MTCILKERIRLVKSMSQSNFLVVYYIIGIDVVCLLFIHIILPCVASEKGISHKIHSEYCLRLRLHKHA